MIVRPSRVHRYQSLGTGPLTTLKNSLFSRFLSCNPTSSKLPCPSHSVISEEVAPVLVAQDEPSSRYQQLLPEHASGKVIIKTQELQRKSAVAARPRDPGLATPAVSRKSAPLRISLSQVTRNIRKSVAARKSRVKSKQSTSTPVEVLKRRRERSRREINIILVTVLFSINFVVWNCIMLYYYFAYIVSPSTEVFKSLAGNNKVLMTYLNGWYYYATFMTSCVNPMIHFVCNSKMRIGLRHLTSF